MLEWRTQWQAAPSQAIEHSFGAADVASAAFESPGVRHSQSSPTEPRTSPARMLDPAQIDHLTEDVIRRVERRIRIERERRGA